MKERSEKFTILLNLLQNISEQNSLLQNFVRDLTK